jgi:hypothetical protein
MPSTLYDKVLIYSKVISMDRVEVVWMEKSI